MQEMRMSKKTLNHANLEALGAEQLADLLMEISTGSADIKRRLRLELSHHLGAEELAHEVRKRLASLRKSNSFVGWRRRKALIKDLNTQAAMITDKIAPTDPTIAFDLLWQFLEMAPSIHGRVDDSKGDVGEVFHAAKQHFTEIAPRAHIDADDLADRVWGAVLENGHGEWDGIISLIAPALGPTGLAHLSDLIQDYGKTPNEDGATDHEAIQFLRQLRGGADYAAQRKARFVQEYLQEIAALQGDTTAYIAQYSPGDLRRKDIAAEVAFLLLLQDRAHEALELLRDADPDASYIEQVAWDDACIACLLALGQTEDAQEHRWSSFLETLNVEHLCDYLKGLPDFDDVDAEDRAKAHVLEYPDVARALQFCLNWSDLLTASHLIYAREDEIDGDTSTRLASATEALRLRHPLAAMLVLRRGIDHVLDHAQSFRYGDTADALADCAALDSDILDYMGFPTHDQFIQLLRSKYQRNFAFWKKVD
jgi:hypothetical protein